MSSVLTVVLFLIGRYFYRMKPFIIFVPVFFSVVGCALYVSISGLDYAKYFEENEPLTFLLGPAVVALGVLLHKHIRSIQSKWMPLVVAVILGSLTSVSLVTLFAFILKLPDHLAASLLPMGITTPIAIEVTTPLGGDPSITSVVVITIGLLGNVMSPSWIQWFGIRDKAAAGLSIGMVSHGIGTARAIQLGETTGLYSGLAMCLNGLITVVTAPLIWELFGGG